MSVSYEAKITPKAQEIDYWKDCWSFRELFLIFAWRDISVRFKQTVVGLGWSVVRPLLSILIFTFVFGKLAKLPSIDDRPYFLVVFCALLPWQFFSTALTNISESLTSNSNLISKIYFPRLIVPLSSIAVPLIDYAITTLLMLLALLFYPQMITLKLLAIIPLTILASFLATGPGLILATLNVSFRDFKHLLPFLIQIGFYISPIGYSLEVIPEDWKLLYEMNPVVGLIECFRWAILDLQTFPVTSFFISIGWLIFLNLFGFTYFRNAERHFADVI